MDVQKHNWLDSVLIIIIIGNSIFMKNQIW